MFGSLCSFLLCLAVCAAAANRVSPPTKLIELSLAVSKASYLQFRPQKFINNGRIMEKDRAKRRKRFFWSKPVEPGDIPACEIAGWTAKSYENHETEVLMFKNNDQKLVVFGFRGTEPTNIQDWKTNLDGKAVESTVGMQTFTTHKGFKDRYGIISSWFEREYKAVPQDYTIVLTGHSLGGAEATIAAVYAAEKLKRKPDAVVTYGTPKVGKPSFKTVYETKVGCDRTLRVVAKWDLITSLPLNYYHVCPEMKIDGKTFFPKAHRLYGGYTQGVDQYKKGNGNNIGFGCNKKLD